MDPAAAIECHVTCYAHILHMHGYFYAGEKFTKLVSYALSSSNMVCVLQVQMTPQQIFLELKCAPGS